MYTFSESLINNEEFTLLFDLNTSKNRDFHHWKYHSLDLNVISENDAYGEFRFLKNDIRRMGTPLRLPNKIVYSSYNDPRINSFEAVCNLFNRLAYPNRYSDMISRFQRTVSQLIVDQMMNKNDPEFGYLLRDLNQTWLSADNLAMFADANHAEGAAPLMAQFVQYLV